jgi:hypothetical protein
MAHVGARPIDLLTLRSVAPTVTSDWQGVARVDGDSVTVTTTRRDPTIVVAGLPPRVDVRLVDGAGEVVDRPIRRN